MQRIGLAAAIAALYLGYLGFTATVASAQDRVALVIGNGRYAHATSLPNPANDARAVGSALREIGFDVAQGEDLDRAGMERLLLEFLRKASSARVALIFYAGHGMQVDGRNYLVPVDAKLEAASDLNFRTVELDKVLASLDDPRRANIVILDACRDNPMTRSFASNTRSAAVGAGLAPYTALGAGTLIAFSTAPGKVAEDGRGANSPFTEGLIRHLRTPGLEVRQMLTRVRSEVAAATADKQVPWDNSSLRGDVYLAGAPTGPAASAPAAPPPIRVDPCAAAEVHWRSAESINSKFAFEDHISRFPSCAFSGLARAKIEALERVAAFAPAPLAPPPVASPTTPSANICPSTPGHLRNSSIELSCYCPANAAGGTVWGTHPYTDDSSICFAARHAGVIDANGGSVRLRAAPGQARYAASTRNGITTSSWERWDGSFVFSGTAVASADRSVSSSQMQCPADVKSYRGTEQRLTCQCSPGAMSGTIWGTGIYTDDSSVCHAAVHAGIITRNGGTVTLITQAGRNSYSGSTKNGVTTQKYGNWGGSFRFTN